MLTLKMKALKFAYDHFRSVVIKDILHLSKKVFSTDGSGNLKFDEFVQMFSSLCPHSPRTMKLHYAFCIYDIDGDGYLGTSDIQQILQLITQGELSKEEIECIANQILVEGDFDDDGKLSKNEFCHIMDKSPDFMTTFNIRI